MSNEELLTEGIISSAGKDLVIYFNQHYGSSLWGKVIAGVKAIEEELQNINLL